MHRCPLGPKTSTEQWVEHGSARALCAVDPRSTRLALRRHHRRRSALRGFGHGFHLLPAADLGVGHALRTRTSLLVDQLRAAFLTQVTLTNFAWHISLQFWELPPSEEATSDPVSATDRYGLRGLSGNERQPRVAQGGATEEAVPAPEMPAPGTKPLRRTLRPGGPCSTPEPPQSLPAGPEPVPRRPSRGRTSQPGGTVATDYSSFASAFTPGCPASSYHVSVLVLSLNKAGPARSVAIFRPGIKSACLTP